MRNFMQSAAVVILALSATHCQAAGIPSLPFTKGTVEVKATKTGGQTLQFSAPGQKGTLELTVDNGTVSINAPAIAGYPAFKLDLAPGVTADQVAMTAKISIADGTSVDIKGTLKGKGAGSFVKLLPQFPVGTFDVAVRVNPIMTNISLDWTNQATKKVEFRMIPDLSMLAAKSLNIGFSDLLSKESTSTSFGWDPTSSVATASSEVTKAGTTTTTDCEFRIDSAVASGLDAHGLKTKEITLNEHFKVVNEKTFDADGKVSTETTYDNDGKVKGKKTFDQDGKVTDETGSSETDNSGETGED